MTIQQKKKSTFNTVIACDLIFMTYRSLVIDCLSYAFIDTIKH